jgi:hypothetical protein
VYSRRAKIHQVFRMLELVTNPQIWMVLRAY